jgi:hypothetical protein
MLSEVVVIPRISATVDPQEAEHAHRLRRPAHLALRDPRRTCARRILGGAASCRDGRNTRRGGGAPRLRGAKPSVTPERSRAPAGAAASLLSPGASPPTRPSLQTSHQASLRRSPAPSSRGISPRSSNRGSTSHSSTTPPSGLPGVLFLGPHPPGLRPSPRRARGHRRPA